VEKMMEYAESKKEVLSDRQYLSICNGCKVVYQLQQISGVEELDSGVKFI
jgi:phosphoribosylformylglycinamidine (FGAM) synthase-like amidotransferase family enzyme